jgi:hypothetical protein
MSATHVRRLKIDATMTRSYLTPSWSTEADSKHGQQPSVRLTQGREDIEHESPDTNEKQDDEKHNRPLGDRNTPQETPVATVGLE